MTVRPPTSSTRRYGSGELSPRLTLAAMRPILIHSMSAAPGTLRSPPIPPTLRFWAPENAGSDGLRASPGGDVFAVGVGGNPVEQPAETALKVLGAGAGRVVCSGGWFEDEEPARRAMRLWSGEAWERLADFGHAVRDADGAPAPSVALWASAETVISDLPSCLGYLHRSEQWSPRGDFSGPARFELIVDPIAMLTPEMWDRAEDHVSRVVAGLGGMEMLPGLGLERVCAVVAGRLPSEAPPNVLTDARFGEILRRHARPDLALILDDSDVPGRLEALGVAR